MTLTFTKVQTLFSIILLCFNLNLSGQTYHRVKIDLNGKELSELTRLGLALPMADFKPGVAIKGEFSEAELDLISEAGFQYEIIISDMSQYYQQRNEGADIRELNQQMHLLKDNNTSYPTPENFMLGSMGGFHTYDELLDDLDAMHTLFPGLISSKTAIGSTTTIEGRPVYWVRISNNPEVVQDKPRVLYTALTHAREPASMQQMLFQMWYLLENYDTDPEIQYLVDNTEMYFVPCVNPDGYIYCETTNPNGGSMHRKNKRNNSDGSIGVDLNRNYGYMWGFDNSGSSPTPSSETYRGTGPFSEPETTLQKEFAEEYNFSLALNNHTYSDLLIYPWGYNDQLTPDGDVFVEYAKIMTRENNYVYGTCYETLNYYANGGSDDWYYGEQETKEKTLAFTPEAGKPSDGFWPQVNRIEEICAGHMHMNLSLARLALSFAEINLLSGQYIEEIDTEIPFEITNLGQQSPSSFTVSILPLSSNIVSTGESAVFTNMTVLETQSSAVAMELHPDITTGSEVKFVLSLDNGDFTWNDTITKYYGQPEVVFTDPCDDLTHWTTSTWGISSEHVHSFPSSIADSPGQNYSNDANTHITLTNPLDLSETSLAWIEFYCKFDIESNWDYVQLMYSVDNQQTWVPLPGNLTSIGGSNQDNGNPLYHGVQTNWEKEEIDLSHLSGQQEVWLRFRLISDGYITKEGFYFDDFTIFSLTQESAFNFYLPETISFYQHEEVVLDFNQLVSWELEGDVQIEWDGNENISMEHMDDNRVSVQNINPAWTGEETITISLEDNLASLQKAVAFHVLPVPPPAITGQQEVQIAQGEELIFLPDFITVEDEFFNYPADFGIILHSGSNYLIEDFTIMPDAEFTGEISIPVIVNNGFADSEAYNFSILVGPETFIDDLTSKITVFYHNRQLVIKTGEQHQNSQYTLYISDITGRTIHTELHAGSATIRLNSLRQGIYIVTLRGEINASQKIIIQ